VQPTTAKDLLEFWPRIAAQGLVAKPAAINYKAAASAVLGGTNTPGDANLKELDVDKLLRQFENLQAKKYKPETMRVVESRFRRALEEFLRWAQNPKAFEPEIGQARPRGDSEAKKTAKSTPKNKAPGTRQPTDEGTPDAIVDEQVIGNGSAMIWYPLPLRPGVVAKLLLPTDLTNADVERIAGFLRFAVLPGGGP
jgi:hypothetical protein